MLFILLLISVFANDLFDLSLDDNLLFQRFKQNYNKIYKDNDEEKKRNIY